MAESSMARARAGFTLTEMLVAIGILLFGVTTLLGVLGVGLQTRRSAEQRQRGNALIGHVLHDLEQRLFQDAAADPQQSPDAPAPLAVDAVPGHDGVRYTATFAVDPAEPDLVLCKIAVLWQEQGATMVEEYKRILVRREPFPSRVGKLRSKT